MSNKKWYVIIVMVAVGMFLWGQYQGVYEYKKGCEAIYEAVTQPIKADE